MGRHAWREVLADPKVLSALREAALQITRDGCIHQHRDEDGSPTEDPAFCDCRENEMLPLDFHDWIEREVKMRKGKGMRLLPAGQPNRKREGQQRIALAIAV